jgi:cytochrome bd-type quinol oxidase subunit 1
VSPQLTAPTVMTSLMLFAIVYNMVLAAFLYFAVRAARKGPAPDTAPPPEPALSPHAHDHAAAGAE